MGCTSPISFADHLARWGLLPDGQAILATNSRLLPVRCGRAPAMLQLAHDDQERRGGALMEWWAGTGAAPVSARDGSALLMERALGDGSLAAMARDGHDDEACRILCAVAGRRHAPRPERLPELMPLSAWFSDLTSQAAGHPSLLSRCGRTAAVLLADERDRCVLHGDIHHGNVLDFGRRGWLAIDPKGLVGELGFDFANIFTNPDLSDADPPVAIKADRFERRMDVVCEASERERERLLRWGARLGGAIGRVAHPVGRIPRRQPPRCAARRSIAGPVAAGPGGSLRWRVIASPTDVAKPCERGPPHRHFSN